jgi:catechol 2,3-dioxygenase-like lactoylglutathione lyase family enzyme
MLMHDEPIVDLAHLGHLEILTPKPEESLRFFVDVMGMTESGTPSSLPDQKPPASATPPFAPGVRRRSKDA